eukprot:GDKK01009428.1.p1 GENE.GDKK01009428.1~~GDKK01009428.1.p1  ORF type:complete len:517 (+),score=95.46 GDKK01009428.1:163-1713(+)
MLFESEHTPEKSANGFVLPDFLKKGLLKDKDGFPILVDLTKPMTHLSLAELKQAIDLVTLKSVQENAAMLHHESELDAQVQTDGCVSRNATIARLLAAQRLLSEHQQSAESMRADFDGSKMPWWKLSGPYGRGEDTDDDKGDQQEEDGDMNATRFMPSETKHELKFNHPVLDRIIDQEKGDFGSFYRIDYPGRVIGNIEDVMEWLKNRPRLKIALLELFYYYESLRPAIKQTNLSLNAGIAAALGKPPHARQGALSSGLFEGVFPAKGTVKKDGKTVFAGGAVGLGEEAVASFLQDLGLPRHTTSVAFNVIYDRFCSVGLPEKREIVSEILNDFETDVRESLGYVLNEIEAGESRKNAILEQHKELASELNAIRDNQEKINTIVEKTKWELMRGMNTIRRLETTKFVPFLYDLCLEHEVSTTKDLRQRILNLYKERMKALRALRVEYPDQPDEILIEHLPPVPSQLMNLQEEDLIRQISSVESFEWFVEDYVMPLYRALLAARATAQTINTHKLPS